MRKPLLFCLAVFLAATFSAGLRAQGAIHSGAPAKVPGVVIDHSPAASGRYIGSPSIVVLPDGDYLASHDFFGPKSGSKVCATTAIFRSTDRGATWQKRAQVQCAFWSNLFVHRGAVYLMGTTGENGHMVIRRSKDDGKTWTHPDSATTGLLAPEGHWHTAPVPVVEHAGRLWRAFENVDIHQPWGLHFRAGVLSVPLNADLLVRSNWTFSNFLPRNAEWLNGDFGGWLEGNAVVAPGGVVVDVLRVDVSKLPEKAAIVKVNADGRKVSFGPASGFINFPGGATKFSIRHDPHGRGYWALTNIVTHESSGNVGGKVKPAAIRNTLALVYSRTLRHWQARSIILHHPDRSHHAFQYADWQFDGRDIVAALRTAYDDGQGGAHTFHDANYLTFYRIRNFRSLRFHKSTGH